MTVQALAAQTSLNRHGEKRSDPAFVTQALKSPFAKVLTLVDLTVPILPSQDGQSARLRWISPAFALALDPTLDFAFLGEDAAGAYLFACALPLDKLGNTLQDWNPLVDLRSLALQGVLSRDELSIAGQALALLGWHAITRCCARCGGRLRMSDAGWRRHCGGCGLETYPRTDPVVIMLITDEEGRCLLGAEHRFPPELYSTLAGFVEAGDDIEHAVRREVREEAGVDVGEVRYIGSQPWPFPHSLMIGCWGRALSAAIRLDRELRDARWFGRAEVEAMMTQTHPQGLVLPPPVSMAHVLLQAFIENGLKT